MPGPCKKETGFSIRQTTVDNIWNDSKCVNSELQAIFLLIMNDSRLFSVSAKVSFARATPGFSPMSKVQKNFRFASQNLHFLFLQNSGKVSPHHQPLGPLGRHSLNKTRWGQRGCLSYTLLWRSNHKPSSRPSLEEWASIKPVSSTKKGLRLLLWDTPHKETREVVIILNTTLQQLSHRGAHMWNKILLVI